MVLASPWDTFCITELLFCWGSGLNDTCPALSSWKQQSSLPLTHIFLSSWGREKMLGFKKNTSWEFPGCAVVRTGLFHFWGLGLIPAQGSKIPASHVVWPKPPPPPRKKKRQKKIQVDMLHLSDPHLEQTPNVYFTVCVYIFLFLSLSVCREAVGSMVHQTFLSWNHKGLCDFSWKSYVENTVEPRQYIDWYPFVVFSIITAMRANNYEALTGCFLSLEIHKTPNWFAVFISIDS